MYKFVNYLGSLSLGKQVLVSLLFGSPYVIVNSSFYEKFFNSTEKGFLKNNPEISENVQKLIKQVEADLNLVDSVEIRTSNKLDSSVKGDLLLRDVRVYLPDFFNVTKFEELKAAKINELLKKEIGYEIANEQDWVSPDGRAVVESFILSDSAKKFVIARDLQRVKNHENSFNFLLISVFCFMTLLLQAKYRNKMILMQQKKLKEKFFGSKDPVQQFLRFSIPISLVFTSMFQTLMQVSFQRDADAYALTKGTKNSRQIRELTFEESKQFDVNYYLGALEFYTKMVERNQALKRLIERDTRLSSWDKLILKGLRVSDNDELATEFAFSNLRNQTRLSNIKNWERS